MTGHDDYINSICFSPDGTHLASYSGYTLRLWDAHTSSALGEVRTGYITSICFSRDGIRLASCSNKGTIRLWDGHTGSAVGEAMTGHTTSVDSICFSPDGTRLASCSDYKTVRIWDAHTGGAIGVVSTLRWISSLRFLSDSLLLGGTPPNEILWNLHLMAPVDLLHADIISEAPLSLLSAGIGQDGWLYVNRRRRLWIPHQYRGCIEGIRRVGEVCSILCIGGTSGSVTFLRLPHTRTGTPF
jgi:WD40 repeat protein